VLTREFHSVTLACIDFQICWYNSHFKISFKFMFEIFWRFAN